MHIDLGRWNTLKINRLVEFGAYLDGGDEDEILMPLRYLPKDAKPGDEVEAFVYLDQQERLIATKEEPKAQVGDFAYLRVAWTNDVGAFLDWGLMKDILCPFREQKMTMLKDRSYIVHIHVDEETARIVASAKVERYLSDEEPNYYRSQEVDLLVWQKTDLGFKVIVDNKFAGLIYDDQVFRPIHTGDKIKGYIEQVRPDGKLDVSIQRVGKGKVLDFSDELFEMLQEEGGFLPYGDKTESEIISEKFGVSKKTFKKAIGKLYKEHKIVINNGGIEEIR